MALTVCGGGLDPTDRVVWPYTNIWWADEWQARDASVRSGTFRQAGSDSSCFADVNLLFDTVPHLFPSSITFTPFFVYRFTTFLSPFYLTPFLPFFSAQ